MRKIQARSLRDGDEVILFGAVVKIQGKPDTIEHGDKIFYSWPNMPIVSGALEFAPEAKRYTVQGSAHSLWHLAPRRRRAR